jgi:hypothetical protein
VKGSRLSSFEPFFLKRLIFPPTEALDFVLIDQFRYRRAHRRLVTADSLVNLLEIKNSV